MLVQLIIIVISLIAYIIKATARLCSRKTKAKIVGYKLFLDIIYNNVFQDKISDKDMKTMVEDVFYTVDWQHPSSLLE